MTPLARREALLDFWTRFYAEQPSTVEVATQTAIARGFDMREIERAREAALEVHLWGGRLPALSGPGVSPGFIELKRNGRGRGWEMPDA